MIGAETPRRITVVGAGVSGLVAGAELIRAGHDVRGWRSCAALLSFSPTK